MKRLNSKDGTRAETSQATRRLHPYAQDPTVFEIFWDCLESVEGIDPALVDELRQKWTPTGWRPLGEILVRRKILTFAQVTQLIGLQLDVPYMRIGELAVREGYCTMDDVQKALASQREEFPGPVELLVSDERLDRDAVLQALLAYSRVLEERVRVFVDCEVGKPSA